MNFIVGILFIERGENKRIYKNYEKWYENVKNQEYERRKKAQEEYQKQQYWKEQSQKWQQYQEYSRQQNKKQDNSNSHFDYQNTNDGGIIQKFEEYLDILKIDKNGEINEDVIKKAYRREIKKVHPDRNSDQTANAKAQELNMVKEFLDNQLEYYLMQRRKGQ